MFCASLNSRMSRLKRKIHKNHISSPIPSEKKSPHNSFFTCGFLKKVTFFCCLVFVSTSHEIQSCPTFYLQVQNGPMRNRRASRPEFPRKSAIQNISSHLKICQNLDLKCKLGRSGMRSLFVVLCTYTLTCEAITGVIYKPGK